jgi:Tol biopolymer transport system component
MVKAISLLPDSGGEASGSSENPSISADGLVVAFDSTATDLVSNDGNFASDIFVRDRSADPPSTVRISVDENGFDANGGSFNPSVSADGLIVAFESTASDLVSGDGNFDRDIFVRDRSSVPESTVRVSVDIADGDANGGSFTPSISADGRFVAFVSLAENLVGTDDTNGFADVFVRDLDAGTTRLVSIASDGTQGNGHSGGIILRVFNPVRVSISSDGRFVVFGSEATNLLDVADTNGIFDIFLHDRDTNANGIFDETGFISTVRVSVTSDGIEANNASSNPSIDSSGRFVAFDSSASNLVSDDGNIFSDVFEAPNFLAP